MGSLLLTLFLSALDDCAGRRRRAQAAPPDGLRDYRPSWVQNCANFPAQMSSFLRKPSLITTSMLSFVIACGLSSTDGTWRAVSSDLPLTRPAGGACFFASAMASFEAA